MYGGLISTIVLIVFSPRVGSQDRDAASLDFAWFRWPTRHRVDPLAFILASWERCRHPMMRTSARSRDGGAFAHRIGAEKAVAH